MSDKKKVPAGKPAVEIQKAKPKPIKVQATALGFYNNKRQRPESIFLIRSMQDFSDKWMTLVPAKPVAEAIVEVEEEPAVDLGEGDDII